MATFVRAVLSGSVNGESLNISGTAGGTTIHTVNTGTAIFEEIHLWAHNNFSQSVELILEVGTSATPAQITKELTSRDGPTLVLPGITLKGASSSSVLVTGYVGGVNGSASVATSAVAVTGHINRIDQS